MVIFLQKENKQECLLALCRSYLVNHLSGLFDFQLMAGNQSNFKAFAWIIQKSGKPV